MALNEPACGNWESHSSVSEPVPGLCLSAPAGPDCSDLSRKGLSGTGSGTEWEAVGGSGRRADVKGNLDAVASAWSLNTDVDGTLRPPKFEKGACNRAVRFSARNRSRTAAWTR